MLKSLGIDFTQNKWVKAGVYGVFLFTMVLGLGLSAVQHAHAEKECYPGSWFEQIYRNKGYHWRAVAVIARRPIDTRIGKWSFYGPRGANLWPDSLSETYGRGYIYFSWPPNLPPTKESLRPQQFTVCLR